MSGTPPPSPSPPVEDTPTPADTLSPPPPPPPESQDTPAPIPPPPPCMATPGVQSTTSSTPKQADQPVSPTQPSSRSTEEQDQPVVKPRRKRRFSPSAQDPTPALTPTTQIQTQQPYFSRIQPSNVASTPKTKPVTANEWEKTAFAGDTNGEKRVKFLRLMGLGKSTKIEAKPEDAEDAIREASKRQKQSLDMERQYEQGRRRQHRFK